MKQKLPIVLIPLVLVSLTLVFFLIENLKPKSAGIMVESDPSSVVYVNNKRVGMTPYVGAWSSGEIILKLIPQSKEGNILPYETRVKLASGIKTVVRRSFAVDPSSSSGEIISFEKTDLPDPSVSVVSNPDAAQVTIDSISKGFTPVRISSVTAGEHQLTVASVGYISKTVSIKTIPNYRLTVVIQLATSTVKSANLPVVNGVATSQTPSPVPMVEILKTPTGFLRVREKSTTASAEVGQVHPGEKYKLLATDKENGWFQISLDATQNGWITNQYAAITPP